MTTGSKEVLFGEFEGWITNANRDDDVVEVMLNIGGPKYLNKTFPREMFAEILNNEEDLVNFIYIEFLKK